MNPLYVLRGMRLESGSTLRRFKPALVVKGYEQQKRAEANKRTLRFTPGPAQRQCDERDSPTDVTGVDEAMDSAADEAASIDSSDL